MPRFSLRSMLFEDFHGYSVPKVKIALARIFREAAEQRSADIYIVTGKGNHINPNGTRGVLKKILPELLKPYTALIEKIEPEPAAYKITLKTILTPSEKFWDIFFSALDNDSAVREQMEHDIEENTLKAENGDINALVQLGST